MGQRNDDGRQQWHACDRRNHSNLTLAGLLATDAGNYRVVVANSSGKATSAVAVLTVLLPPTITIQPTNSVTIEQGGLVV